MEKDFLALNMIVDTATSDEDITNNPELPDIISSIQENLQMVANKISAEFLIEPPTINIPTEISVNYTPTYGLTNKKEHSITIYAIKKSSGYYYSQDYLLMLDTLAHELSHYLVSMKHNVKWRTYYLIIKQKMGALLL